MIYFFDVESYPNFFSVLFLAENGEKHTFISSQHEDNTKELIKFLNQQDLELVGYNSIGYDNLILSSIMGQNHKRPYRAAYTLTQHIINDNYNGYKQYKRIDRPWKSIDLMAIIAANMNRPSLKKCAIHLRWDRVQDLPYPPNKSLTKEEIERVIAYNWNDVELTKRLYYELESEIDLRRSISSEYSIDLLSASESKIANEIYNAKYGEPRLQKTHRNMISGLDLIPQRLGFVTPQMKRLQREIERISLVQDKNEKRNFHFTLHFGGTEYKLGVGGLHSVDKPGLFEASDDLIIQDADVSSYYPMIIINETLIPAHLDQRWFQIFIKIVEDRLRAKKEKDHITAKLLKIVVNSTFGKLNSRYFWLRDELAFFRVTLAGQLYLLDLIEKMHIAGIKTISANTDGIICEYRPDQQADYDAVCKEWEKRTRFELEYNRYKTYARLNVNSYIAVTTNGKVKTKKDFDANAPLPNGRLPGGVWSFRKGYSAPIIAKALVKYFAEGIEPEDYIGTTSCTDIHDYFYTQKTGKKFTLYGRSLEGDEPLQKTNRYYVTGSYKGVALVKKGGKRDISILKGKVVCIVNDIGTDEQLPIKFSHYITETRKLIEKIEGTKQMSMNLQIEEPKQETPEEDFRELPIEANIRRNGRFQSFPTTMIGLARAIRKGFAYRDNGQYFTVAINAPLDVVFAEWTYANLFASFGYTNNGITYVLFHGGSKEDVISNLVSHDGLTVLESNGEFSPPTKPEMIGNWSAILSQSGKERKYETNRV